MKAKLGTHIQTAGLPSAWNWKMANSLKKGKIFRFYYINFYGLLKKANYLINSQKFVGQPILKKVKFVFLCLEKAKPGNPARQRPPPLGDGGFRRERWARVPIGRPGPRFPPGLGRQTHATSFISLSLSLSLSLTPSVCVCVCLPIMVMTRPPIGQDDFPPGPAHRPICASLEIISSLRTRPTWEEATAMR